MATDHDKLEEFARLVQQMRAAQKAYFLDRSPQSLRFAKDLERRVDEWVAKFFDRQIRMF